MKLRDLIEGIALGNDPRTKELLSENPEIHGICFDSRKAQTGTLFIAIPGFVVDGKKFLAKAFAAGATLAVVDSREGVPEEFQRSCLVVPNPRRALATIAANFFKRPTRELLLIGVTGTNGKTSCAHLLASILSAAGHVTALMGTVERSYPGRREPSEHTTQESLEIQAFLRDARSAGATAAVIEVSSHALSLDRVAECEFDAALFTNLEPDHQDFYNGMEPYYLAKRSLFEGINPKTSPKKMIGIVNEMDPYGQRLLKEAQIPCFGFGEKGSDYSLSRLESSGSAIVGVIDRKPALEIPIYSRLAATRFNLANVAACVALAHKIGIPIPAISAGVSALAEIPGRLTRVPTNSRVQVYVDFAHSGPKLRSVLQALRDIARGRLIAVFGAGGDKDPLRRTRMGEAAADLADITVVTTDNPRSEDPAKIIAAIEHAWHAQQKLNSRPTKIIVEPDRERAIRLALQMAEGDDIVCIAGKGHEQGQIVKDKVFPFDDAEVASRCLEEFAKCSP